MVVGPVGAAVEAVPFNASLTVAPFGFAASAGLATVPAAAGSVVVAVLSFLQADNPMITAKLLRL